MHEVLADCLASVKQSMIVRSFCFRSIKAPVNFCSKSAKVEVVLLEKETRGELEALAKILLITQSETFVCLTMFLFKRFVGPLIDKMRFSADTDHIILIC